MRKDYNRFKAEIKKAPEGEAKEYEKVCLWRASNNVSVFANKGPFLLSILAS